MNPTAAGALGEQVVPGLRRVLAGGVLRLLIDREDKLNALTAELMTALATQVRRAGADPSVRGVLIHARGRTFCAGADLDNADADLSDPSPATVDAASRLVLAIRDAPRPVVVAARGGVVGVGVSILLAADLAYLTDDAYLLLAFCRVGLMPDGGATALLAAHVGRATAMRLALLGERLAASETAGLVAGVWPSAEYDERLADLLARLGAAPTMALARTKAAINAVTIGSLPVVCEREREGQLELLSSPDVAEGLAAFAEKRPAVFAGFAAAGSSEV